jgi:hypothetical protein
MPRDLVDKDIPVKIEEHGMSAVVRYILSMVRCPNSGNGKNFRSEYFRSPVRIHEGPEGVQNWVIYRTGMASAKENPDLYSAKKSSVTAGMTMELSERSAFGAVVLGGHGTVQIDGKEALPIESVSMYPDRDTLGGDEFFVAAEAARRFKLQCRSMERMAVYQHFASGSNPETQSLKVPEFRPFS